MSKFNPSEITDTLSAPIDTLIASIGKGVAQAQQAMDMKTIETFMSIHTGDEKAYKILRQMGYQPTWYKIPEIKANIMVSLNISGGNSNNSQQQLPEGQTQTTAPIKIYATPMDAGYAGKYNYSLQATSQLEFRIVPVPPSAKAADMKIIPELKNQTYEKACQLLNLIGIAYNFQEGRAEPAPTDIIDSIKLQAKALTVAKTNQTEAVSGDPIMPDQMLILECIKT